ncbi:MAG: PCMD domain-containing protein [Bacteroidales bacterium]|nr:PCMD domain-containing protein [Bacteroidales bacterium]
MSKRIYFALFALLTLVLASCIKDEALNSEADIVSCTIVGDVLSRAPIIGNDSITLMVKEGTDVAHLDPLFELSQGATIVPASGTMLDFSDVQHYVVTSEDGQWHKRYAVRVVSVGGGEEDNGLFFAFEKVVSKSMGTINYPAFAENATSSRSAFEWGSGNAGFALTGMASDFSQYPTHQSAGGHTGACAELVTCSTGAFGSMAGKPLAAGNLFLGNFDMSKAMSNPLAATQFGMMFEAEPQTLSGWYEYIPGATFYVADASASGGLRAVGDRSDHCAIYAVFFEVTDDVPYLYGDNVLAASNPNIILTAELPAEQCGATGGWQHFEIPFVPRPGKSVDATKLRRGQYSLTVVFSSSEGGATFEGAIGSRLKVDDVSVTIKSEQ